MDYKNIDIETNIEKIDFVFFDLETTGLNGNEDKIIEIGALKIKNEDTLGEFSALVDPGMKLPAKITEITNITDSMLSGKPGIQITLKEFLPFIKDCVLVGHNINFDLAFLKKASFDNDFGNIENQTVDTLNLARRKFPKFKSYKLQDLISVFNFEKNNAHRALDDCYSCMKIFYKCIYEGAFMGQMPPLKDIID